MSVHASSTPGGLAYRFFKGSPDQRGNVEVEIAGDERRSYEVTIRSSGEWEIEERPRGKLVVNITGQSVRYLFESLVQFSFIRDCIRPDLLPHIDRELALRKGS